MLSSIVDTTRGQTTRRELSGWYDVPKRWGDRRDTVLPKGRVKYLLQKSGVIECCKKVGLGNIIEKFG